VRETLPSAPLRDRAEGLLLGIAVGDAYGLPWEGLSRSTVARRFDGAPRYRLLGRVGFVSDDTDQTALLMSALLRGRGDVATTVRLFRRSMVGWFWRLPWGIGLSTLKACLLMSIGVRRSGRPSAGNGAAMRAAPVALVFPADVEARRAFSDALARTTHTDPRAVQGARFVVELTASCLHATADDDPGELVRNASVAVADERLLRAIEEGLASAVEPGRLADLESSGYVLHTLATAVACFCLPTASPFESLERCVRQGGDTDTIGAVLGGWLGALHGSEAWPPELLQNLERSVYVHLLRLAAALVEGGPVPRRNPLFLLVRNLLLYPVVIAHGLRRLIPF
jgi:ADP-ribosylglycohydrolase